MKEIVIIRSKDDIDNIDTITKEKEKEKESIAGNLFGLLKIYPQFAYSFESGDVLFAIYEEKLQISLESACKFFDIKQFYFDDKEHEDFQCYWYNAESNDIVCALDKDGYMRIIGNVIYDSLFSKESSE